MFDTIWVQELPSPVTLMFNRPIRCLIPKLSIPFILFNHDHDHNASLIGGQQNTDKNEYAQKSYTFPPTGLTVVMQREDGSPWTHGMVVGHDSKD